MATPHWSKDMAQLWWRDKGTQRMRVSFHRDPAKLKAKYERLYHDDIDAALYSADGNRIPLSAVAMGGSKKKRQRKAPKQLAKPDALSAV